MAKVFSSRKREIPFLSKISTRISIAVIFCFVVAMTVTMIIATGTAKASLMDEAQKTLQSVAKEKDSFLEQYVESQKTLTHSVATDPFLVEAAKEYKKTGVIDTTWQARMGSLLEQYQEDDASVHENFFVQFYDGQASADCWGSSSLTNVSGEEFFETSKTEGCFFGNNLSPATGKPCYVIAYAITDPDTGEFIGCVNNSLDTAIMSAQVIADEEYDVTIFDLEGVIISSPEEELLLSSMKDSYPEVWNTYMSQNKGHYSYQNTSKNAEYYTGFAKSDNFICEVAVTKSKIIAGATLVRNYLSVVSAILTLLVIIVVAIDAKVLLDPLNRTTRRLNDIIQSIEDGHGDLTTRVDVKKNDEVGAISRGINTFIDKLVELLSEVQTASETLSKSVVKLNKTAEITQDSANSISATMEEMSAGTEETAANTNQITKQIEEIGEKTQELSTNAKNKTTELVKLIGEVEKKRLVVLDTDKKLNEKLNTVLKELQVVIESTKKVSEVEQMSNVILDVSSQTNLLSLNASIEAARAGEAGRGFAVVASEIGSLANNSNEAAQNIQKITAEVMAIVNELVRKTTEVSDMIVEINKENSDTKISTLDEYYNSVNECCEIIKNISDSNLKTTSAIENIKDFMQAIDKASEENANGISMTASNTVELVNITKDVIDGAVEVNNISTELVEQIVKFEF